MKICNLKEKSTNRLFPAEVRQWSDDKLVTVHRGWDDPHLVVQEFTEYNDGQWENSEFVANVTTPTVENNKEVTVRVSKSDTNHWDKRK